MSSRGSLHYQGVAHIRRNNIKQVAKTAIVAQGKHRPNWVAYVLARLNLVVLPMNTWNLHLFSIQQAARKHKWTEDPLPYPPADDLVRLPANSTSGFH